VKLKIEMEIKTNKPINRHISIYVAFWRSCGHTIQYNSVYLTRSKKLTGSQLSPPHEINKKIK